MSFQDKLLDSFIAFEQVIDLENPIHTDRKNALKRFVVLVMMINLFIVGVEQKLKIS